MSEIRYKFLHGRTSEYGDMKWRLRKWYKIEGNLEMCWNGFHCSKYIQDALQYVQGDTLAVVKVRGKSINENDKECWEEMMIVSLHPFTKEYAVKMAVYSARLCLSAFASEYPDDDRPRKALEAAEAWLKNPCDETESAARSAARSAAKGRIHEYVLSIVTEGD